MHTLGFHHAAIQVRDVERVAAFYRDVLGLPELSRHAHDDGSLRSIWLAVSTGGGASAGFLAVEHASTPAASQMLGHSMIALRIDASTRAEVIAELGTHDVPVFKQTRWTMYVRDPEGNVVGLSHHPYDPPKV